MHADGSEIGEEVIRYQSCLLKNSAFCPHEVCPYLEKKESNCEIVYEELFRFVGLFMMKGDGLISYSLSDGKIPDANQFALKFIAKYDISKSLKGKENSNPNYSYVISCVPFMIAEHLHLGNFPIPKLLDKLPKCLAFTGGWSLIPYERKWEPLYILWKLWMSTMNGEEWDNLWRYDYQDIHYLRPENELLHSFMRDLNITSPSPNYVLRIIEMMLQEHGHIGNFLKVEIFKSVFPRYADTLHKFYTRYKSNEKIGKLQSKMYGR